MPSDAYAITDFRIEHTTPDLALLASERRPSYARKFFGRLSMRARAVRQRDESPRSYTKPTLCVGEPQLWPILQTPSACTACSARPSASIAPSSTRRAGQWLPRTALPARSTRATRGWAAATACRSRFRSATHAFGGTYVELTPHERIRYTDTFEDPHLPGEMHVAVTLRPVAGGTDLAIVQEGLPAAMPVEMCYLGWQESLRQLADLVEAEMPDGA